jgi:hypothetical protein
LYWHHVTSGKNALENTENTAYILYIYYIYVYIYILQIANDHCWIVDVGFQVETQLQFAMLQGSAEHLDWAQP